jgi:hypothetical protein
VQLISSVTLTRTVAAIGVPSDDVNFWFLAELNHGRPRDEVSQKPAINQTLTIPTIPAIFRMPRSLRSARRWVWFTRGNIAVGIVSAPAKWALQGCPPSSIGSNNGSSFHRRLSDASARPLPPYAVAALG